MFIFVRVMLKGMPNYDRTLSEGVVSNVDETVMNELWQELIQAKTLLVPGSYYAPWQGRDAPIANQGHGHFRFAYSVATVSQ
jgi:aromatic amino acid aminotransferase I